MKAIRYVGDLPEIKVIHSLLKSDGPQASQHRSCKLNTNIDPCVFLSCIVDIALNNENTNLKSQHKENQNTPDPVVNQTLSQTEIACK